MRERPLVVLGLLLASCAVAGCYYDAPLGNGDHVWIARHPVGMFNGSISPFDTVYHCGLVDGVATCVEAEFKDHAVFPAPTPVIGVVHTSKSESSARQPSAPPEGESKNGFQAPTVHYCSDTQSCPAGWACDMTTGVCRHLLNY